MLFSAAARLGGAVPAVMFGGVMTLLVVGLTTAKARQLFVVSLPDNNTFPQKHTIFVKFACCTTCTICAHFPRYCNFWVWYKENYCGVTRPVFSGFWWRHSTNC